MRDQHVHVVYATGSHGKFLTLALNQLTSPVPLYNDLNHDVFDLVPIGAGDIFVPSHCANTLDPSATKINILVSKNSYLKYLIMVFTRNYQQRFTLADYERDCLSIMTQHSILRHFGADIKQLGAGSSQITSANLREWCRLCFFHNQGATITEWLRTSQLVLPNHVFDFEWFYNHLFLTRCLKLLKTLGLNVYQHNLAGLINLFNLNPYKHIDKKCEIIQNSILQHQQIAIPNNFILHAYIDQWLSETFGLDVLVPNNYWKTSLELCQAYDL